MSDSELQKQKGLAVTIAKSATDSERVALTAWIEGMLEIRDSTDSARTKAQKAVTLTSSSGVILPIIKSIGRELTPAALSELSEGLDEIYRSQLPPVEKVKRASSLAYKKRRKWLGVIVGLRHVSLWYVQFQGWLCLGVRELV